MDWWDRALNKGTPAVKPTPQPYAPSKVARWEDSHPPTYGSAEPQAVPQRPQEGIVGLSAHDVLNGYAGAYRPNTQKVQSLREGNDIGRCPQCDSPNYMSRSQGVSRGPTPAPRCMDCGYLGGGVYWQEATPGQAGQATRSARQVANPNSPAYMGGRVDFQHPVAHLK